ncbi:hypothetical protein [Desulfobacula sp.]|uniref:hypothetical protein n=1 Tax=Desulfobacula sp. TaxID=2593537 RepID=UPI0025B95E63|nr:hypothetical protein [Desulfobacula sp.]MBC2703510.1 hypothetical protein [Desulfobacula sp.]
MWVHGHNAKLDRPHEFSLERKAGCALIQSPAPFQTAYYAEFYQWQTVRNWVHFEVPTASLCKQVKEEEDKRKTTYGNLQPLSIELVKVHVRFVNPWAKDAVDADWAMGEIYGIKVWDAETMIWDEQFDWSVKQQTPTGKQYPYKNNSMIGYAVTDWTTVTWPDIGRNSKKWGKKLVHFGVGISLDIGLTQSWSKPGAIWISAVGCDFLVDT